MNYFVFDMDETLAELYSVYYFVASLRLNEIVNEHSEFESLPQDFKYTLDKAYDLFVKEVLKEEKSPFPLGVLRPGILNVMRRLYELQKAGKIKNVLIYSNNGHLQSLEFIRDLIHKHLGTRQLIKECIHWNHHMRNEERTLKPGAANKTWNVLKNIMVHGNCRAPVTIEPSNVYFFDDLDHEDLQEKLGENYYKVPPYEFKASFDRLSDIYLESLLEAEVDMLIFLRYIYKIFGRPNSQNNSLNAVVKMFKDKTRGTSSESPPPPDKAIDVMMSAIDRLKYSGGKRYSFRVLDTRKRKQMRYRRKRTHRKI